MIKTIVLWPNAILRKKIEPVEGSYFGSSDLRHVIENLLDTVRYHNGAGLAAPQIGADVRAFVIPSLGGGVFVNPTVVRRSPEKEMMAEGCLSLPGITENVSRHTWIEFRALSVAGRNHEGLLRGFPAQVFQHELDHLNGKMYPDRMDPGAKDRLRQQLRDRR
jgi:peptide deformylase